MLLLRRFRASLSWSAGAGALVIAGASLSQVAACGATGEVEGGEPFDGGTMVVTPVTGDDDAGEGDSGPTKPTMKGCAGPDASTGSTYTELYHDYFGPSGGANCSGTAGACHGDSSGAGALGSGGFVCGTTQDDCFTGMNLTTADLLSSSDTTHPASSGLEVALRKAESNGTTNNMPLVPVSCVFSDEDIARISAWISAGAQNN